MLRKLFTRKSSKPVKAPSAVAKNPVAEPVSAPQTLAQWADLIESRTGKAKTQTIAGLVEQIRQGNFDVREACAELPGNISVMIAVELEQPTEGVSEAQWSELVTQGFSARIRKTAASHVHDADRVSELARKTKGKDKAVYRILHATQERQQSEQKAQRALEMKQSAVLEAIAKLAKAPVEPLYEVKLKGLTEQWQDLKVKDEQAGRQFEQARLEAQQKVDAVHEHELEEQSRAQSIDAADANRQALIDQLTARMQQRLSDMIMTDQIRSDDQHLLNEVQRQWRDIEKTSKASQEVARTFQKTCTAFEVGMARLQRLMAQFGDIEQITQQLADADKDNDQLLHDVDDWLHEVDGMLTGDLPPGVLQLKQALETYQQSLAEHRQHEIHRIRALRGQMRRCMQAVEEGSLRRASGLYHGVQEKLEGFDLSAHGGVRKQYEETTEALEKLRDWQSYAVLPKKEALIKRMSALVEQSVDPESRAQSIRDMQDEWKLLSRGLQDRQQDLWETFHELAQKAYEPCREYFAEQKHLRDINLERRRDIIAQLNQYAGLVDWDNPDIKEVDRILQVARNDWRHYSPVDRIANKPVQAEFDRLHQSLYERMRQEQKVYRENKEAIIEQARALLEYDDVREATEQAKALQHEWKSAGMVARKDEQQLWKAFRKVCDELFERRDQQVNAFKADLEANREHAEDVLSAMEQLTDASDILSQQPAFENLKTEYEQIGTLPKANFSALSGRYREACRAFDAGCRKARHAQADQHWEALIEWVRHARFDEQTTETLLAEWQELTVPEQARSLKTAIAGWQRPADEAAESAMHEKTIDLEILTGVDSPTEDSDIRMNLQVQRLSEGIGSEVSQTQFHQAVVDWLAIGAVSENRYSEFATRMKAARKAWLG